VATFRIELNRSGIRSLLNSREVRDMLLDRAEQVAEAARARGIMVEDEPGDVPLPIEARAGGYGKTRTRAWVTIDHESGEAVESKHRLLVGSLDAAR
jgi:hypothetical protein